jgi:hypothetical protein
VVEIALAVRPDGFESVAEPRDWHEVQRAAGRLCVRWLLGSAPGLGFWKAVSIQVRRNLAEWETPWR